MAYSFFLSSAKSMTVPLTPLVITVNIVTPTIIGGAEIDVPFVLDTYGTLAEAAEYFAARLHAHAWEDAPAADRPKALWGATLIIDALNYKGFKSTVYTLLQENPSATEEEIREAEASQELEFPRGADTVVPQEIRTACYEITHALLDGRDPDFELEALGITSQSFGGVRTAYNRSQIPIEHIVNCVPSTQAWHWLKPFLREAEATILTRTS